MWVIFTTCFDDLCFIIRSRAFQYVAVPAVAFVLFQFVAWIYHVATTESGIHYVGWRRQRVEMFNFYNPFSFTAEFANATLESGVKVTLKSKKACIFRFLWGVQIDMLADFLKKPPLEIRCTIQTPCTTFTRTCEESSYFDTLSDNGKLETVVRTENPNGVRESLKTCRRFPLVILMALSRESELLYGNAVVCVAYAIHLHDQSIPIQSQLVDHYAKLSTGQVTRMKKIYGDSADDDVKEDGTLSCIICFQRRTCVVLLPCRHSCVCENCFMNCSTCPMCRNLTPYYYRMQCT